MEVQVGQGIVVSRVVRYSPESGYVEHGKSCQPEDKGCKYDADKHGDSGDDEALSLHHCADIPP